MTDALRAVAASAKDPSADSRALLTEAINRLLAAGLADGSLRQDLDANDILVGVTGVALATALYGDRTQASRLLDLMMRSYVASD